MKEAIRVDQDRTGQQPDRQARWPRNRQRDRVLGLVREYNGAVDVTTLAQRTGLHVTTIRFHLDGLCSAGLVARTRINRQGVGRPRTGYVAVQGRMDYRSVVEVLAMELGDTVAERRQKAQRAGRRWAARILTETPEADGAAGDDKDRLESQTALATTVFERMGFAPDPDTSTTAADVPSTGRAARQRTIRLRGCPVRELALEYPEVSCGIHLGLLQGLADADPGSAPERCAASSLQVELEPFVTPEL
ncbi:MAG TPA: transcriptional regulator, partial [Mycolicibacillus parakoreensis]|nr:transcriptional regulator [Mycolicibacillus parakoreensis]